MWPRFGNVSINLRGCRQDNIHVEALRALPQKLRSLIPRLSIKRDRHYRKLLQNCERRFKDKSLRCDYETVEVVRDRGALDVWWPASGERKALTSTLVFRPSKIYRLGPCNEEEEYMNSQSEPLIWQTWSEKWGSWENWFQARNPHNIPEESMRNPQRSDFGSDQASITQLERSNKPFRAMEPA